jgi:3-oxoacyl-[acyl-carrier protein] reductase
MIELTDKVVLVTGGARGIGKAIVLACIKAGAKVCFTNRTKETAISLEEEIKTLGGDCFSFQGDIANPEDCQKVIKLVIEKYGKIDILVNNAGITKDNVFLRMKLEDWNDVINTNLTGIFNMTKAVTKPMMKARYGRVINISSIVGYTGNPGQVNYSSSKAGIIGFSKSFAKELASRNITCNVIAPGFIETDMTAKLTEEQQKGMLAGIPLGRMGSAEDIANGVLYLASPMADYITGTTLHINGGMF